MTTPEPSGSAVARGLNGGAAGILAAILFAATETLLRAGGDPSLTSPLRDAAWIALGGAGCGAAGGILRSVRSLRFLSPFGITLGLLAALHFWLAQVSGSRVLESGPARVALNGAALLAGGAVAGQLAGSLLRRWIAPSPRPLRDGALIVTAAAAAVAPWGGGGGAADRPNLLLLSVDTLRSDRLGFAGSPDAFTPHLDRLSRTSLLTMHAVTPLPRTLPAMVSVMTGHVPQEHGVRDNFHYSLGPRAETLAEELQSRGWATAAINSNPVLSHESGVYQGFATANDRGDDWARLGIVRGVSRLATLVAMRRGDRDGVITELALQWLAGRPAGRPWFLWVHWLAPHMPYEPEYPFDRLWDPDYDGPSPGRLDYDEISKGDMTYRNPLDPARLRHAIALYDGEVATSDRAVGRLLRGMEAAGDLEGTVIAFIADHGESLDEHGYFFNHGDFVYGPAANVPFLWRPAGGTAGEVSTRPASLTDVYPGLLAAAEGRPHPATAGPLFGESGFCRFPHLNERLGWQLPREIAQSPDAVADWDTEWAERANRAKQRFLVRDEWKLVRSPREDGDVNELFDLRTDPGERHDIAAEHPGRVSALSAELDAWIEAGIGAETAATSRTLDEEAKEQLEGLGYLGD